MSWVYPPKVTLFITFFSWKSQIEYLHWLSALAVWILGGGENVSKLVNIQELEENRLSCQNLFNLFWKIFPLGTLSHLEQVPEIFFKTLQRWHVFCCLCKTFLNLTDYLHPLIPTSSTSCCDSAAEQSLSPCSMPAMLWLLLLLDAAWCAVTLQSTWRCRFGVKVQTYLPERREMCMKTSPGAVFLCCFPQLRGHNCCCCWGKTGDSLFCVPGTELLCEVPACGTDSGCSHGRLCRHFALRLGAGGVWEAREEFWPVALASGGVLSCFFELDLDSWWQRSCCAALPWPGGRMIMMMMMMMVVWAAVPLQWLCWVPVVGRLCSIWVLLVSPSAIL